jgi:hypothetical protein
MLTGSRRDGAWPQNTQRASPSEESGCRSSRFAMKNGLPVRRYRRSATNAHQGGPPKCSTPDSIYPESASTSACSLTWGSWSTSSIAGLGRRDRRRPEGQGPGRGVEPDQIWKPGRSCIGTFISAGVQRRLNISAVVNPRIRSPSARSPANKRKGTATLTVNNLPNPGELCGGAITPLTAGSSSKRKQRSS